MLLKKRSPELTSGIRLNSFEAARLSHSGLRSGPVRDPSRVVAEDVKNAVGSDGPTTQFESVKHFKRHDLRRGLGYFVRKLDKHIVTKEVRDHNCQKESRDRDCGTPLFTHLRPVPLTFNHVLQGTLLPFQHRPPRGGILHSIPRIFNLLARPVPWSVNTPSP